MLRQLRGWMAVGFCLALAQAGLAETVDIRPSADAAIQSALGASAGPESANMGAHNELVVGTTEQNQLRRSLLHFDILGAVPKGSIIHSTTLRLRVSRTPSDGGTGSKVGFYPLLKPWGEGTKTGRNGQPATAGEVTWRSARHGEAAWGVPGTGAGVDYDPSSLVTIDVDDTAVYTVPMGPRFTFAVQNWLEAPELNFGVLMRSLSEEVAGTARRIASRENLSESPILSVDFTPPAPAFGITSFSVKGNEIALSWAGGRSLYQIQIRDSFNDGWRSVGEPTKETSVTLPLGGAEAYYRVLSDYSARYQVRFDATWSLQTHPQEWPAGAHWSPMVGGVHNDKVSFWNPGGIASLGIEQMAELGATPTLVSEVSSAITSGNALVALQDRGPGGFSSPGSRTYLHESPSGRSFPVNRDFPLVTLVSMIAPSPDWFVGVSGLNLFESGGWVPSKTVSLFGHDAGSDNGSTYESPDLDANPRGVIEVFTGFPGVVDGTPVPFGSFTFTRVTE